MHDRVYEKRTWESFIAHDFRLPAELPIFDFHGITQGLQVLAESVNCLPEKRFVLPGAVYPGDFSRKEEFRARKTPFVEVPIQGVLPRAFQLNIFRVFQRDLEPFAMELIFDSHLYVKP